MENSLALPHFSISSGVPDQIRRLQQPQAVTEIKSRSLRLPAIQRALAFQFHSTAWTLSVLTPAPGITPSPLTLKNVSVMDSSYYRATHGRTLWTTALPFSPRSSRKTAV